MSKAVFKELIEKIDWESLSIEADQMFKDLFPICRSITGNGVRETLDYFSEKTEFKQTEIPTGTKCYDWEIPDEWNIRDAYIADMQGNRIIDFNERNIHVLIYSEPIDKVVDFAELDEHLHYLEQLPHAIPYRTSYYKRNWGFCLSYDQYKTLDREAKYHVVIDSSLEPGSLTYGDAIQEGNSGREFIISTYCCHPSIANDNLSGPILWALLKRIMSQVDTLHSYRFVIVPETIGAIAYLNHNEEEMKKVEGGFIPTTCAGPGKFGHKKSWQGDSLVDRIIEKTFDEVNLDVIDYPFDINGSDERHYSAPLFRIPICTISKDKYYEYIQYHTSLDDLDFVKGEYLVESLKLYLKAISMLEADRTYLTQNPGCEAQLGKRGLYPNTGGSFKQGAVTGQAHEGREYKVDLGNVMPGEEIDAITLTMFWSDGDHSVFDIAEKVGFPVDQIQRICFMLEKHGLLKELA